MQSQAKAEPAPLIGGPGDPRMPSIYGFDTPQFGTETPYRKTPRRLWCTPTLPHCRSRLRPSMRA